MDVQFDNEQFARTQPIAVGRKDWAELLVARGWIKSRAQAQSLLIGIIIVATAVSIFLISRTGTTLNENPEQVPAVAGPRGAR